MDRHRRSTEAQSAAQPSQKRGFASFLKASGGAGKAPQGIRKKRFPVSRVIAAQSAGGTPLISASLSQT